MLKPARHAVAVLLLLALTGCGNLRQQAYVARLAFNVPAKLVVVLRRAGKLDDATYVAAYEVMKEGAAALADLDARVARITAIEQDTTLSDEQKKIAIAREENAFEISAAVLDRLVPLLERWQSEGLAKPGPATPAIGPAPPAPAPPAETFPEPPPPIP